mgnify:CR=1 FL=1
MSEYKIFLYFTSLSEEKYLLLVIITTFLSFNYFNLLFKKITKNHLTKDNIDAITSYINNPMTATWFREEEQKEGNLTFVYFTNGKYEVDLSVNYNGTSYGGFIQAMYWAEE